MLVVTKKENESIKIEPIAGADPSLTLRELFAHGSIVLKLAHVGQRRVRIVIEAPSALRVIRNETRADAGPPGSSDGPRKRLTLSEG